MTKPKRTSRERRSPKSRHSRSKRTSTLQKFSFFIVGLTLLSIPLVWFVYQSFSLQEDKQELIAQNEELVSKNRELINKLQSSLDQQGDLNFTVTYDNEHEVEINYLSEIQDYQASSKLPPPPKNTRILAIPPRHDIAKPVIKNGVPKLAIIIDDMAFPKHLKAINQLHIKVTPSFFPSSSYHKESAKLASKHPFAMIHLPLEAFRFNRQEKDTLLTTFSESEIERVVRKVRHEFPYVKYINGHTGSKFTSDLESMKRLLFVLEKYDFQFIDSRTTPHSKVVEAGSIMGKKIFERDVFLDNKPDRDYIRGQLKQAVKKAKKNGYAIAIGHPHPETIRALATSDDLLVGVETVYVEQLFEYLK